MQELIPVFTSIIAALIYAVGSYLKNSTPEKFDPEKLFITILIAVLVGAAGYYLGTAYDTTTQILASAGIIVYVEVWGKAVYRKLKTWLGA